MISYIVITTILPDSIQLPKIMDRAYKIQDFICCHCLNSPRLPEIMNRAYKIRSFFKFLTLSLYYDNHLVDIIHSLPYIQALVYLTQFLYG